MSSPLVCPDDDRLRALLDGTMPEAQQAELNVHLETCAKCQQAIERLAAGKETWDGTARQLASEQPEPDEALRRAMNEAKSPGNSGDTQGGSGRGQPSLDFLKPSNQSGHLGRLEHYEVLELTGHGGFGIVLKAFDTSLRRIVAIKVLSPHLATNATARRRFIREAVAAAAVSHDHVVAIHAVEESHDPPFIVMQFIEGKSLQERIDQSGPLELKEILRIGVQTAAGLAAAHAQGLVHRDIKPANILLENSVERVKITDFGLARAVDDASVTQRGVVAGTPQYMSPEQSRGEPVDARADLFSLGSVMYAMCTGGPPFRATTAVAVLRRVCDDTPRPIREINPDIPDWLEAIIATLLAKRPADRFQSASEVRELLAQHLAHLQQPAIVPHPAPVAAPIPIRVAGVESASPQPKSNIERSFIFWTILPRFTIWHLRVAPVLLVICFGGAVAIDTAARHLFAITDVWFWAQDIAWKASRRLMLRGPAWVPGQLVFQLILDIPRWLVFGMVGFGLGLVRSRLAHTSAWLVAFFSLAWLFIRDPSPSVVEFELAVRAGGLVFVLLAWLAGWAVRGRAYDRKWVVQSSRVRVALQILLFAAVTAIASYGWTMLRMRIRS